jgi:hypothetical protein
MIQKVRIANSKSRLDRARAIIARAKDKPPHPSLNQSAGAHGARLDRGIDDRVRQAVVVNLSRGFTESDDLGMRSRIAIFASAVPGDGEQRVANDNAGADGDFVALSRFVSGGERLTHPARVNFCLRAHNLHRKFFPQTTKAQL